MNLKLEGACKMLVKDGVHYLATPEGEILPHQIRSVVIDKAEEVPIARVTLFVNLEDSKTNII